MKRHARATAPAGAHEYQLRIYYEDTDAGGIVYHASYLRFAERARTEALRALGVPHAELEAQHGLILVVRRIKMEYLRPARLDDWLSVRTEVLHVGGATVALRQGFQGEAGPLAVLEAGLACVRRGDGRPARIPDRWRSALAGDLGRGDDGAGGEAVESG
jgi:acyl-CoA thioester hydrolase